MLDLARRKGSPSDRAIPLNGNRSAKRGGRQLCLAQCAVIWMKCALSTGVLELRQL